MNERLAKARNVIHLRFDDQMENPGGIVDQVEAWLDSVGYPVRRLAPPPDPFVPAGYPDSEDKALMTQAVRKLFTEEEILFGGPASLIRNTRS